MTSNSSQALYSLLWFKVIQIGLEGSNIHIFYVPISRFIVPYAKLVFPSKIASNELRSDIIFLKDPCPSIKFINYNF